LRINLVSKIGGGVTKGEAIHLPRWVDLSISYKMLRKSRNKFQICVGALPGVKMIQFRLVYPRITGSVGRVRHGPMNALLRCGFVTAQCGIGSQGRGSGRNLGHVLGPCSPTTGSDIGMTPGRSVTDDISDVGVRALGKAFDSDSSFA
jgi:hypothetical protein